MKATELITHLQKIVSEHGDLLIFIRNDGFGGHSINTFGEISKTPDTLRTGWIEDPDPIVIKELWDVELQYDDEDKLYEQLDNLPELKYLEISSGTEIYST